MFNWRMIPAACEHTSILRDLIKYPQGNLEEVQQNTLQSTQEESVGRPYRRARTYATGRTWAYSTKRYTAVDLCYMTQAYTTWHKLCYMTYDLCCVHRTIRHMVCYYEHRRGNTYASSGSVSAHSPSWEGKRTYVRFLEQVKAIGTYLVRTCAYRRFVQRRGGFQYNNVLCSMQPAQWEDQCSLTQGHRTSSQYLFNPPFGRRACYTPRTEKKCTMSRIGLHRWYRCP